MTGIVNRILDWVYPPVCVSCRALLPLNESARFLCSLCLAGFLRIKPPVCKKCGNPVDSAADVCEYCAGRLYYIEGNHSAFFYDEQMRGVIHNMKFRADRRAAVGLGQLWGACAEGGLFEIPAEYKSAALVPLPMHKKKRNERGFDQAEIMAGALADVFSLPMEKALIRANDTPPQAGLSPNKRIENVRGAFVVDGKIFEKGKRYIIIDDIFTTGASVNECAKTLISAGSEAVFALTLAKSVKKSS